MFVFRMFVMLETLPPSPSAKQGVLFFQIETDQPSGDTYNVACWDAHKLASSSVRLPDCCRLEEATSLLLIPSAVVPTQSNGCSGLPALFLLRRSAGNSSRRSTVQRTAIAGS